MGIGGCLKCQCWYHNCLKRTAIHTCPIVSISVVGCNGCWCLCLSLHRLWCCVVLWKLMIVQLLYKFVQFLGMLI